jgi:hypothetical protein
MARKRASTNSLLDSFWEFVEANPKLAATVALQLGIMAGEAVASPNGTVRSMTKRAKKVPQQIVDAMPRSLSAAALKYLPGPSPKLQPRKRPAAKVRSRRRTKLAQSNEQTRP